MAVICGGAHSDENKQIRGGKPGDQTGGEVSRNDWYLSDKGWRCFRANNPTARANIAYDMEAACDNDNIGYNQAERNWLYRVSKSLSIPFDCALVTTPCDCDCTSLIRVCLAYAGINVPSNFQSLNAARLLLETGEFTEMIGPGYTESSQMLIRGDILITATRGHGMVVLTNGSGAAPMPPHVWHAQSTGGYSETGNDAFENALCTYSVLAAQGWSLNAVCGLLGNIGHESAYNPWRWQNDNVLSTTDVSLIEHGSIGYGLVQFTPAGKYIYSEAAQALGYYAPNFRDQAGNPNDGYAQLLYINDHADYYPTQAYPISYAKYKTAYEVPETMAAIWLYNYERPADPAATLAARQASARYWWTILGQYDPPPFNPGVPDDGSHGRMPVWMMVDYYI